MHIADVTPSLLGLDDSEVNVEIPIRLLRASNIIDKLPHSLVHLLVVLVGKKITRRLDPFGDITVPEQAFRYGPVKVRSIIDRMPLELEARVAARLSKLSQLRLDGDSTDGLASGLEHGGAIEGRETKGALRVVHCDGGHVAWE